MLRLRNKLPIFIIALFSLVPLLWFKKGLLIAGGDGSIFLNPVNYLQSFVRYPVPDLNGVLPHEVCLIFPFLLFFQCCQYIGLSLISSEKILFVTYFIAAGLSMHYLMSVVLRDDGPFSGVARLIASLFYMFNYFVILLTPLLSQFIVYVLLPLILGLYIRGIQPVTPLLKRSILFVCVLSLLPMAYANPPFLAMIVLILALYTVYDLIVINRFSNVIRIVQFGAVSVVLYVVLNLWFLAVWYLYFKGSGGVSEAILPGYWNPGSTIDQTFVLHGSWAWNEVYFPFYTYFEKTVFKVFLYLLPVAAFGLLISKKNNLKVYFFFLIAFIGVFMAKGRWGLCGNIYVYLYDHCPMFWMFREPHAKFTVWTVLGYAVLLGGTVSAIARRLSEMCGNVRSHPAAARSAVISVTAAAVLFICVNAWPAFTGDMIFDRRGDIPGFRVKIPDYWRETADYFNTQKGDFRIVELPQNTWASIWLGWEHGFAAGGNPVNFLFNKSTIHSPSLNTVSRQFYRQLREGSTTALYKLLQLLHVKYLFQRNDYLWKVLETDSPEKVKKMLGNQERIILKHCYGKIDVYESQSASSLFNATDKLAGVFGGSAALGAMSMLYDIEDVGLYFFGQSCEKEDRQYLQIVSPVILFNSSIEDVARDMIGSEYKVIPSAFLKWGDSDVQRCWVPASDVSREPFNQDERALLSGCQLSSRCGVFTASRNPLTMRYRAQGDGTYVVLARYAAFADARLRVDIDAARLAPGTDTADGNRLYWRECGRIHLSEGLHSVSLLNEGGRLFVDAIIIAPEEALLKNEEDVKKVFEGKDMPVEYVFASTGKRTDTIAVHIAKKGIYRIAAVPRVEDRGVARIELRVDDSVTTLNRDAGGGGVYGNDVALEAGLHRIQAVNGWCYVRVSPAVTADRPAYPVVTYSKHGSGRYLLDIEQHAKPYFLIFKDVYDANWELHRINGPDAGFRVKPFDLFSGFRNDRNLERIHKQYIVYGYANAYYMNSPDGGRYVLEHRLQRVFETSILISLASAVICFIITVYLSIKT